MFFLLTLSSDSFFWLFLFVFSSLSLSLSRSLSLLFLFLFSSLLFLFSFSSLSLLFLFSFSSLSLLFLFSFSSLSLLFLFSFSFCFSFSFSFSSLLFSDSSLALPTSAFSSVHIVGSLTSRLPSAIVISCHCYVNSIQLQVTALLVATLRFWWWMLGRFDSAPWGAGNSGLAMANRNIAIYGKLFYWVIVSIVMENLWKKSITISPIFSIVVDLHLYSLVNHDVHWFSWLLEDTVSLTLW